MTFCGSCGTQRQETTDRFCRSCGTPLDTAATDDQDHDGSSADDAEVTSSSSNGVDTPNASPTGPAQDAPPPDDHVEPEPTQHAAEEPAQVDAQTAGPAAADGPLAAAHTADSDTDSDVDAGTGEPTDSSGTPGTAADDPGTPPDGSAPPEDLDSLLAAANTLIAQHDANAAAAETDEPPPGRKRGWIIGLALLAVGLLVGLVAVWLTAGDDPGGVVLADATSPTATPTPTRTTPDVIGMDVADATATLRAADLDVERQEEVTDDASDGEVIATDPEPGDSVDRDDTVILTVAATPTPTPTRDAADTDDSTTVAAAPPPPPPPPAPAPVPSRVGIVTITSDHSAAGEVAAIFDTWATGINVGDYQSSFNTYTSALQNRVGYAQFADGNATSIIEQIELTGITGNSSGALTAYVEFISTQAPEDGPNGQTCTVWSMAYGITAPPRLIASVDAINGTPRGC